MNELQVFQNEEFGTVRTVEINGEPWFVAADIAKALDYRMASDMTRRLDDEDKGTQKVSTLGGEQNMTVINESGLYSAILGSNLPSAKQFKHWVTAEVLPAIRKTGSYNLPQTYSEALRALADKAEEAERLALENKEMKPKALFADAVKTSKKSIKVRDLATILKQNGIDMGEKRLYKWFRENGYICKYENLPTQKAMNLGLFEVETVKVDRSEYAPIITRTTKVTGKGQIYFVNKFLSERR